MPNSTRSFVLIAAAIVAAGLLITSASYAAPEEATVSSTQEASDIIDVGNKICPLTGENVDGKTFYVYKGKRYGLCCPQCGDNFAQDPETYSMLAEKEVSGK